MSQGDSTQNGRKQLSRRRYAQILAGASVAGVAGCLSSSDGGNGDENEEDDTDDDGPQRETLRVHIGTVPDEANFNAWSDSTQNAGRNYFTEISAPINLQEGGSYLSGHTWDASWIDGRDEISIPTMYTGFDVEPPYDIYEYFNEDLTYWDGTPLNTQAKLYEDKLDHFTDGHHLSDGATFDYEMVDDWTYHRWEGQAGEGSPRTEAVLRSGAVETQNAPPHPDFTRPYVEDFEDVTTESESNRVIENLGNESFDYYDLAENEWGSGLYKIDPDQIGEETMVATKRDDHPNEHATIEQIEFQMTSTERRTRLAQQGNLDLGQGMIQESSGNINRGNLPDHIQELDRYPQNNGDQFLFNWATNPHLQNLWVRRAFIAAIDWRSVGNNGWGSEVSIPNEHHICMLDSVAETLFDDEFLDSLYQYPIEQDIELATEWLERAGYSGSTSSGWESPDGETLSLELDMNRGQPDWTGAIETIDANLVRLGVDTDIASITNDTWQQRYAENNVVYESSIFWISGDNMWDYYDSNGQWWRQPLVGGDPDSDWAGDVNYSNYSEVDNHGRPFEQEIPTDVGSIDAPDEAGRQPTLSNGELISLPELCEALQNPDLGIDFDEAAKKLAQYANFYVPYFTFHSYRWGTWGNVRDFNFPEAGHPAHRAWKEHSSEQYHTLSGIVQHKYDADYPEP